MKKLLLFFGLSVGLVLFMGFVLITYLFPAAFADAVDKALWGVPGYSGQIWAWAGSMEEGGEWAAPGRLRVSQIKYKGIKMEMRFECRPLVTHWSAIYITDFFGSPRECANGPCNHPGIDIGTNYKPGATIVSPMAGVVTYIANYGDWGNTVVIENEGYQVLLTHLSDFSVQEGDIVYPGDVVGISGGVAGTEGAGSSTGPHLHFEVRQCEEVKDKPGEYYCHAIDPLTALLPGQEVVCDWYTVNVYGEKNK